MKILTSVFFFFIRKAGRVSSYLFLISSFSLCHWSYFSVYVDRVNLTVQGSYFRSIFTILFIALLLIYYLFKLLFGCPRPALCHSGRDRLTNPMLITAFSTISTRRFSGTSWRGWIPKPGRALSGSNATRRSARLRLQVTFGSWWPLVPHIYLRS